MHYFKTQDQAEIFYTDLGHGHPVILIHGWPLSSDMWEYQRLALLERGFRVIAYDRRGFGKSSQPLSGYDYNTLADDLKELVDHLALGQFSLVGFSMGGGEIARYLSKHGAARVTRAALISSVVPYMLKTSTNPDGVPEEMFDQMMEDIRKDRPKFLAGFNKTFFGVNMIHSPVSDEMMDWTTHLAYQASLRSTIQCVKAFGKTDFRPDLAAFTVPTLIIHGTADKTVPMACTADEAVKAIPNAIIQRYEGAPHGLFITHGEQLSEDIISFMKPGTYRPKNSDDLSPEELITSSNFI